MSNTSVKKLNNLVSAFLTENEGVDNLESNWLAPTIQKQVKSLFSNKGDGRKHKDPNAPKRGKSAYLWFCSEHRDAVKEDLGPETMATTITTELGARWNSLKNDKKRAKELARYQKLASDDKDRYESEKTNYVPPANEHDDGRKKRKRSDKTGPKRAKSAYLYFCDEKRHEVKATDPDMKATAVTTKLGELWHVLKNDPKRAGELKRYETLAAEDKARYDSEKDVPSDTKKGATGKKSSAKSAPVAPKKGGKTESVKAAPAKTSKKKASKPVDTDDVVDEPSSSKKTSKSQNNYHAFCSARREELKQENPKLKPADITKKLSEEWKNLSAEEKANY